MQAVAEEGMNRGGAGMNAHTADMLVCTHKNEKTEAAAGRMLSDIYQVCARLTCCDQ